MSNSGPSSDACKEIELKLRLDSETALDVFNVPVVLTLTKAAPITQDLNSTYYDTKDYALLNANMALRVRSVEGNYIQTVKTAGKVINGLHQRGEWESPLTDQNPQLALVSDPIIRQKLKDIAAKSPLEPVFTTLFARTMVVCHLDQDNQIELCLDQGEILAGDAVIPICEVELELTQGNNIAGLFQLAAAIAQEVPVELAIQSKAWQGYRLAKLPQDGKKYSTLPPITPTAPTFFLEEAQKYS